MKINKELVHMAWWEDEAGNKWFHPPAPGSMQPPPDKYCYYHTIDTDVRHNVQRLTTEDDKLHCDHDLVSTDGEWIDGITGRRCRRCGASQSKNVDEPWPDEWGATFVHIVASNYGFFDDLALAMANSGEWRLREALVIASQACERCMNALLYKYGLTGGYEEYSLKWSKAGTECEYCQQMEPGKFARIDPSPLAGLP